MRLKPKPLRQQAADGSEREQITRVRLASLLRVATPGQLRIRFAAYRNCRAFPAVG
jgi:hypothetical protein